MKRRGIGKKGIVIVCSLVYFVSYFSRKDFAAAMAGMIFAEAIDKSLGGLIGMGLFICYGVGQLISGYLGDKIKPATLIISGLATTMLCNMLMPLVGGGYLLPYRLGAPTKYPPTVGDAVEALTEGVGGGQLQTALMLGHIECEAHPTVAPLQSK